MVHTNQRQHLYCQLVQQPQTVTTQCFVTLTRPMPTTSKKTATYRLLQRHVLQFGYSNYPAIHVNSRFLYTSKHFHSYSNYPPSDVVYREFGDTVVRGHGTRRSLRSPAAADMAGHHCAPPPVSSFASCALWHGMARHMPTSGPIHSPNTGWLRR